MSTSREKQDCNGQKRQLLFLAADLTGLFRQNASKDLTCGVLLSLYCMYLGIRITRDAGNEQSGQLVRYHCLGAINDYSSNEFELRLALLLRAYLLGMSRRLETATARPCISYFVLVLYVQFELEPYRAAGQPHNCIRMVVRSESVPRRRVCSHPV